MRPSIGAVALSVAVFASMFAVAATLARPASAAAPTLVLVDGNGTSVAQPAVIDELYPGGPSAVARYVVGVTSAGPRADLAIGFDDLFDDERGCLRPERAAGDVTCRDTDPDGELSSQLLVSVVTGPVTVGRACPAVLATATMVAGPLPLSAVAGLRFPIEATPLLPGQHRCVEVTYTLPLSADNLVQSDRVRFDVVFSGQQDTSSSRLGPSRPIGPAVPDPTEPVAEPELPSGVDSGGEERPSSPPEGPVEVLPTVVDREPAVPDGVVMPAGPDVAPVGAGAPLPRTGTGIVLPALLAAVALGIGWLLTRSTGRPSRSSDR